MYIYIYIHIHIHHHIYIYIFIVIFIYIYTYTYTYVYIYIYIYCVLHVLDVYVKGEQCRRPTEYNSVILYLENAAAMPFEEKRADERRSDPKLLH